MATQRIGRRDGKWAIATYVRHVRTLTGGGRNDDIDIYRLKDGTEIECISPSCDGRAIPRECDPASDRYPGHRPGE